MDNNPLSYRDWYKTNNTIPAADALRVYNEYITSFYKTKATAIVTEKEQIRQSYIYFLETLGVEYASEHEKNFYSNIDFSDELDVQSIIPLYVKTLKDIAAKIKTKRVDKRHTKLKYNLIATEKAIERFFYRFILDNYTNRKSSSFADIADVIDGFAVKIEELYDVSNPVTNSITTSGWLSAGSIVSSPTVSANDYLGADFYYVSGGKALPLVTSGSKQDNLYNISAPNFSYYTSSSSLKSEVELGGFFLPNNLGVSSYIALDIDYSIALSGEGMVINDPAVYDNVRGLSDVDFESPVTHKVSKEWIKAENISERYDGNVINSSNLQKFQPYQTRSESLTFDINGVVFARDDYEFWSGDFKDIWKVDGAFPLNWRGQFDLSEKIVKLLDQDKELYSWNTDIFGNQYGLYKRNSEVSLILAGDPYGNWSSGLSSIPIPQEYIQSVDEYGNVTYFRADYMKLSLDYKKNAPGELWIRTKDNKIQTVATALSEIIDKYSSNSYAGNSLLSNEIIELKVYNDILLFVVANAVLVERIGFDFDTAKISSKSSRFSFISANAEYDGKKYVGNHFDQKNNRLYVCIAVLENNLDRTYLYPEIYEFDFTHNTRLTIISKSTIPNIVDFEIIYPYSPAFTLMTVDSFCFSYNSVLQKFEFIFNYKSPAYNTLQMIKHTL